MAAKTGKFRFYKGRPVKRMREVRDGILLTFVSAVRGKPGPQLTITQADWDRYGEHRDVDSTRMDDMRALVKERTK